MKFIHAADIHLDSPLHGLSGYPDAPADQLRNASREALRQLVDAAIEESVAFLIVAGDLYDGDWRDHNTGIFFSQQMGRLRKAGIRAFIVWGNHDAESEMTKKLTLPDNVTALGSRKPEVHVLDDLKVRSMAKASRTRQSSTTWRPGIRPRCWALQHRGATYRARRLRCARELRAVHTRRTPCEGL